MITKIPKKGATPARLIDYLASERRNGASVVVTNLAGSGAGEWAAQIEAVARTHRKKQGAFVKHLILSFAPEDPVSTLNLQEIVRFYLERMGYGEAPFVALLHEDREHRHLHIVTTPTTWHGAAISESWDWVASEKAAREIERRWGLRPVEGSHRSATRSLERGELATSVRQAEPPARRQFQEELAEAALRSRSFDEFVARAERAGYEVRVRLDEAGQLAGLSFGRGDHTFSGAQLGRDFRGTRFLRAFSLSLSPSSRSEVPMAEPLAPEPDLSPKPIPEGRYHLSAVVPARLADPQGHLAPDQLAWVRAGWDLSHLERSAEWLRQENRHLALLIRPQPGEETHLGFRGLGLEQVAALKAQGLEPAWVVQVGERFDVLLRLPEKLPESEARQLRAQLAERFELPAASGAQVDAVHLPGSRVRSDGPRAELVEVRSEPVSKGRDWVEALREERARGQVLERAREISVPRELERAPALALAEAARGRPQLPEPGFLSGLQEQVEAVRQRPPERDPLLASQSDGRLVELARQASREAGNVPGEWVREHDARLLAMEGEIRRRGNVAFEALREVEVRRDQARGAVETALARSESPKAGVRELRAYRQALAALAPLEAEHGEKARGYARWLWAEASLDRERFALAFEVKPSREGLDALGEAIARELRLERLAGGNPTSELAPGASRSQLEGHLAGVEGYLEAARRQVEKLPEAERATVQTALREREVTRLVLGRISLEQEPPTRPALEQAVEGRNAQGAVQAFLDYREELAGRAALEAQIGSVATVAQDRLPEAAARVARGDLSPEALRQLNGSLVALDGAGSARLPSREAAGEPREWVARFVALEKEIRRDAGAVVTQGGAGTPEARQRLLANASEAVGLHQRLERLQRALLQVADPGQAPKGVSATAWKTAWLLQAIEKGLSPDLAASQLGNLAQAPALASSFVPGGRALGTALMAARFTAGVANRWVERVLRH